MTSQWLMEILFGFGRNYCKQSRAMIVSQQGRDVISVGKAPF